MSVHLRAHHAIGYRPVWRRGYRRVQSWRHRVYDPAPFYRDPFDYGGVLGTGELGTGVLSERGALGLGILGF